MLKRHLSGWELKISSILFCPSLTTKIAGSAVFWLGYNYRRKLIEKTIGHSLREWLTNPIFSYLLYFFLVGHGAREGVIIECPLNWQYHNCRDVILTSQMAVSNNFITGTVIQNMWSDRWVQYHSNLRRRKAPCDGNIKKKLP